MLRWPSRCALLVSLVIAVGILALEAYLRTRYPTHLVLRRVSPDGSESITAMEWPVETGAERELQLLSEVYLSRTTVTYAIWYEARVSIGVPIPFAELRWHKPRSVGVITNCEAFRRIGRVAFEEVDWKSLALDIILLFWGVSFVSHRGALFAAQASAIWRKQRTARRLRCAQCGYDIRACTDARCSECGAPFELDGLTPTETVRQP